MTGVMPTQEMNYPPGKFVSVYTTSKRIHSQQLLDLRGKWPHLYFTAKWPVVRDVTSEQSRPAVHWLQDNVDDIIRSDVFLCWAEPDDDLNGSIWECGVAWAHGKPIYLVGSNAGYKEWKYARNTRIIPNLDTALQEIQDRIKLRESDAQRIMTAIGGLDQRLTQVETNTKQPSP